MSKVRDLGTINTAGVVTPNEYKNNVKGDLEEQMEGKANAWGYLIGTQMGLAGKIAGHG